VGKLTNAGGGFLSFDPTNLATPAMLALWLTYDKVIPWALKRKNGNSSNGTYLGACKAAGAVGSMSSELLSTSIGAAFGKEISVPLARMATAIEESNKNMIVLITRIQVESEQRRRN